MFDSNRFDLDSFGDIAPANWQEIADALNDIARGYAEEENDDAELRDRCARLWEDYWTGAIPDAPAPRFWVLIDEDGLDLHAFLLGEFEDMYKLNAQVLENVDRRGAARALVSAWEHLTPAEHRARENFYAVCAPCRPGERDGACTVDICGGTWWIDDNAPGCAYLTVKRSGCLELHRVITAEHYARDGRLIRTEQLQAGPADAITDAVDHLDGITCPPDQDRVEIIVSHFPAGLDDYTDAPAIAESTDWILPD